MIAKNMSDTKDFSTRDWSPDRRVSINNRNVPVQLRNRFKAWCAENNVTMETALIKLMQAAVEGRVKL